jgi:hypothetical protein
MTASEMCVVGEDAGVTNLTPTLEYIHAGIYERRRRERTTQCRVTLTRNRGLQLLSNIGESGFTNAQESRLAARGGVSS